MEDVMLQCKVCCERYDFIHRRPKVLLCGHTFCLSCLYTSSNKCFTCHSLFEGSPLKLTDNFILLSATDNTSAPSKKIFWCLDCKKGADANCEDGHAICSMKKISEQIGVLCEEVQEQLRKEEETLNKIVIKLAPVNLSIRGFTAGVEQEVMAHGLAKDEVVKLLKTIPETENNLGSNSFGTLNLHASNSKERIQALQMKAQLLEMLENCEITLKPLNSDTHCSFKCGVNGELSEHDGLYYSLYRIIGRQHLNIPEAVVVPCAGDVATTPIRSSISPALSGICVIQVTQNSSLLGKIAISLIDTMAPQKKDLLIRGLNGVKLFPKFKGVLTGSTKTQLYLKSNSVKLSKGSVAFSNTPLQPMSIFLENPKKDVPNYRMFVWGKVVENLELLEAIVKNWPNTSKSPVVLTCPCWV